MIRVVLDTNIVLSAFLWAGNPYQIIEHAEQGRIITIADEATITELQQVISRPKFAPALAKIGRTPEEFINRYQKLVVRVAPAPIAPHIIADPKDDKFLACALGGGADYIVSGDQHLLALGAYEGVKIVSAEDFLALLP